MVKIEDGQVYGTDQILSGIGHRNMELVIPMGAVVKRGDAVTVDATLSDGTDLFGIVLEDADGTLGKTKTTVVVFGEVIYEFLNTKAGTDKAEFVKKARNKGIAIKFLGGKQ